MRDAVDLRDLIDFTVVDLAVGSTIFSSFSSFSSASLQKVLTTALPHTLSCFVTNDFLARADVYLVSRCSFKSEFCLENYLKVFSVWSYVEGRAQFIGVIGFS